MDRGVAGPSSPCYATTVMAGGDNLGRDIRQTFSEMNEEWVIKSDPDFIMKLGIFFTEEQRKKSGETAAALVGEITGRKGWESVKAVVKGGVFVLDEGLCGGPRGMVGAYAAASRFHPSLVGPGESGEIMREYLERFQRLPYEPQ